MAEARDLLSLLEEIAPIHLAEDWDNSGLMVGSLANEVKKVALALDPSCAMIQAAAKAEAQALLTHHPLIFRPLRSLNFDQPPAAAAALAIRLNLTVICAHTNLDKAPGGVSWTLAQILELKDIEILAPEGPPDAQIGFGCFGQLAAPQSMSELAAFVREKLMIGSVRVCAPPESPIDRVAVVPGSSGSFISAAQARGAQVLIGGDFSYHHAREAEFFGLGLLDAGHWATERPALDQLAERLRTAAREKSLDLEFMILADEADPWL